MERIGIGQLSCILFLTLGGKEIRKEEGMFYTLDWVVVVATNGYTTYSQRLAPSSVQCLGPRLARVLPA